MIMKSCPFSCKVDQAPSLSRQTQIADGHDVSGVEQFHHKLQKVSHTRLAVLTDVCRSSRLIIDIGVHEVNGR